MKKHNSKRLLAAMLALIMVISLIGCGNEAATPTEGASAATESGGEAPVAEKTTVTFPLEEEMTFDIMVRYDGDLEAKLENCGFWQRLYEMTNVKVNFILLPTEGTMGTMNAMFAANQEGDAILGGSVINESDLSLMAANGLLMPMNEYIDNAELMPNFNERVLSESPETKGYITLPDGNIYSLPKYTALEGNYLESPLWINKAWLDQLGMEIPTTIEELEAALIAFRDNDMNGNGDNSDEIPYIFLSGHSFSHMEAILGLWGIATKDGTNDNYVYVENGKVNFAPASAAYKEALTTLNSWYEENLIWSECFTGTQETFNSKISAETPMVGMFAAKTITAGYEDDYVQIAPVSVEGYEANWYRHPGRLGGKGQFSLTRSCENPEVLMAWIDLFYALENTVAINYGEEEDGRWQINSDGKYEFITLPNERTEELKETSPLLYELLTNLPSAFTADDYENSVVLSSVQALYQESYAIYEEYMTDEFWPRPYIAEDDVSRLAELRTDIFNTVAEKRAAWVTGVSDIEAEWDAYLETLNKIGVDEFVEILQRNYDSFLAGQK